MGLTMTKASGEQYRDNYHEYCSRIKDGVESWNNWRWENPEIRPSLRKADLRDMRLQEADLSEVELYLTDLRGTDLMMANLNKAELIGACLSGVELFDADLSESNLQSADLRGANLHSANFSGADLTDANLKGAKLDNANLTGTVLRGTKGYVLDRTCIKNTIFSPGSRDPWAVLRRWYTGPMMLFNLVLVILFLVTFFIEAATQVYYSEYSTSNVKNCLLASICKEFEVWKLFLGVNKEDLMWRHVPFLDNSFFEHYVPNVPYWMLSALLLLYNILRMILTNRVSLMREEEVRSNYAPKFGGFGGYGILYLVHIWIMRTLSLVAAIVLLVRLYDFSTIVIFIPTNT